MNMYKISLKINAASDSFAAKNRARAKIVTKMLLVATTCCVFSAIAAAKVCVVASSFGPMFTSSNRFSFLNNGHIVAYKQAHMSYINSFYDAKGSDLSLVQETQKAIRDGCTVLVGFYTSKECLLAGPLLVKNKLVGISSSCGHDDISKYWPHLFTAVPEIDSYSLVIARYLNEQKGDVFIVHQPTDVFSTIFFNQIVSKIHRHFKNIEVQFDGSFKGDLSQISRPRLKTIVFTTYPRSSVALLSRLTTLNAVDNHINLIASSSWAFDLSVIRQFRSQLLKAHSALVPDVWSGASGDPNVSRIFHNSQELGYFSYDITKLALTCDRQSESKKQFHYKRFVSCLHTKNFRGITGTYDYSRKSPFPKRVVRLYDLKARLK